ncbi:hypothetical protein BC827DRAFT_1211276 [Russula dissimulans]|nr:hypothetical protein BC827DRAFT_1211276 [Russula dissimulans]
MHQAELNLKVWSLFTSFSLVINVLADGPPLCTSRSIVQSEWRFRKTGLLVVHNIMAYVKLRLSKADTWHSLSATDCRGSVPGPSVSTMDSFKERDTQY